MRSRGFWDSSHSEIEATPKETIEVVTHSGRDLPKTIFPRNPMPQKNPS